MPSVAESRIPETRIQREGCPVPRRPVSPPRTPIINVYVGIGIPAKLVTEHSSGEASRVSCAFVRDARNVSSMRPLLGR